MAHNNWYILEKLIQSLDAPWSHIYLHIDRKSKDFCKEYFLNLPKYANISLVRRHNITWGNESQISAEMSLFKAAYKAGPYHYYHFLSGTDLPLLSASEIYDFFSNQNMNYLDCVPDIERYEWRLQIYSNIFRSKRIPNAIRAKLNIAAEITQHKLKTNRLVALKKKYPILGKGNNWCDLTHKAVECLVKAESDIRRFTRFTHCTDEMYKQIVLLNQPSTVIGPISSDRIRYIDWSAGGNHPHVFTVADFDSLVEASLKPAVFARKFDEAIDREVIDRIVNFINNKH